jgi:glycosyltransferase involved in cell wall biosynthesis
MEDETRVGRRILRLLKEDLPTYRRMLHAVNRHTWTPHSLGVLKERNMMKRGEHLKNPAKCRSMNFPQRKNDEWSLVRRRHDPFSPTIPPARILVETSHTIAHAAYLGGCSERKEKVILVPGVDTKIYKPRPHVDHADMQALFTHLEGAGGVPSDIVKRMRDAPEEMNVVVEASRMESSKRKDLLVESFAVLMQRLPPTTRESTYLFITGTRASDTAEIYDDLASKVSTLGLSGHVFLVGRVPNEAMGAFLGMPWGKGKGSFRTAQYVTTSGMEGWAMAAQQGVAGGLPLVGSSFTPVADYLKEKAQAALVVSEETDGPADYATAMQWVIDHPDAAGAMAQRALPIVKKHDWVKSFRRYSDRVERILGL